MTIGECQCWNNKCTSELPGMIFGIFALATGEHLKMLFLLRALLNLSIYLYVPCVIFGLWYAWHNEPDAKKMKNGVAISLFPFALFFLVNFLSLFMKF